MRNELKLILEIHGVVFRWLSEKSGFSNIHYQSSANFLSHTIKDWLSKDLVHIE